MKFASFDLEIAKVIENDTPDWRSMTPLGITCAAVALTGCDDPRFWHGRPKLTQEECCKLVADLQAIVAEGYTLLTWNGSSFDFAVLAEESGMYRECVELNAMHIDMMLLVTFVKGYFLGLQKALIGAGLAGKLKHVTLNDGTPLTEMNGALAPKLWAQGECDAVLSYLRDDVLQPLLLAEHIEREKKIRWTSNAGKPQFVAVPKLLTVRECFSLPIPDTSWMKDPPSRGHFIEWTIPYLPCPSEQFYPGLV
ncbi:MAG TPA: hypothetical protein VK470_14370, partial [Bacteroidota bacterium]|nr:hypothetical protein [Bacteroidota bacterium]